MAKAHKSVIDEALLRDAFTSKAEVEAFRWHEAPPFFHIRGYASAGDGGRAFYKPSATEPTHIGKIMLTMRGGATAWYVIDEEVLTPRMLGIRAGTDVDKAPALQQWLDAVVALGVKGAIRERGTYRLDTGLTATVPWIDIEAGPGVFFSLENAANGTIGLTVQGTIGSWFPMSTAPNVKGSRSVRTGASFAQSVAVGDILRMTSLDKFDSFNTNINQGELNYVEEITDPANGYFDVGIPLQAGYHSTPQIAIVSAARDVRIKGFQFIGKTAEQNVQYGVRLIYVWGGDVENCGGRFLDHAGIFLQDCAHVNVISPKVARARPASTGYGVTVVDATQDIIISKGHFVDVRHSLSTNNSSSPGGVVRRITFAHNTVNGSSFARAGSMGPGDAVDTHGAAEDIHILDNFIAGSQGAGINFECRSGIIARNTVVGAAGHGITVHNESDFNGAITISDNVVRGTGNLGIYVMNGTRGTTAYYDTLKITGNEVSGAATMSYQLGYSSMAEKMRNIQFTGNSGKGGSSLAMYLYNAFRPTIMGNTLEQRDAGDQYIFRTYNCIYGIFANNMLVMQDTATLDGAYFYATAAGLTRGWTITGNQGTTKGSAIISRHAILLSNNVEQTVVTGNNFLLTAGVSLGTGAGNAEYGNIL